MYVIDKEERVRGDLKITFKVVDDEVCSFDDSDTWGKVVDYPEPGAMRRDSYRDYRSYDGYLSEGYYVPSQTVEELVAYYVSTGDSKGSAYLRAAESRKREMEEYDSRFDGDNWYMAGLIVEVSYKGKVIASDSLWGIELSTFTYSQNNEAVLREVAVDVLAQAISEALRIALKFNDADAAFRLQSLDAAMDRFLVQERKRVRREYKTSRIREWRAGKISAKYAKIGA